MTIRLRPGVTVLLMLAASCRGGSDGRPGTSSGADSATVEVDAARPDGTAPEADAAGPAMPDVAEGVADRPVATGEDRPGASDDGRKDQAGSGGSLDGPGTSGAGGAGGTGGSGGTAGAGEDPPL